ncbi:MAG: hypothetical protein IIW92_10570 [Lachnospiraceae bacterium]|nr:hypothetical protein [Lachnospiraceae bacterium]
MMSTEYKTYEWCPYCDTEVDAPIDLSIFICPSCGKHIINCGQCNNIKCDTCELYEEARIANGET